MSLNNPHKLGFSLQGIPSYKRAVIHSEPIQLCQTIRETQDRIHTLFGERFCYDGRFRAVRMGEG